MAVLELSNNNQANESLSKYKLLSSYGGPGSIVHTQYGSIIISCIEEWGFLKKIIELDKNAKDLGKEPYKYVIENAELPKNGGITISNDSRLLNSLKDRKKLRNLKYLALIPNIDLKELNNKIESGVEFSIPSSYMPKIFFDSQDNYKSYSKWFKEYSAKSNGRDRYGKMFFPPKKILNTNLIDFEVEKLKQDNLVLICEHGHISDFPWSKFLNWRIESPTAISQRNVTHDLFNLDDCCNKPAIKITSSSSNSSGFDGKWLKCNNCKKNISLKGIMSLKIQCPGHLPWESDSGESNYYSGNVNSRNSNPPREDCQSANGMKVALTTGNNLYYSRVVSSIYMPDNLFKSDLEIEIENLEKGMEKFQKRYSEAREEGDQETEGFYWNKLQKTREELKLKRENLPEKLELSDSEKEVYYRFQEFNALCKKDVKFINENTDHLKVKDVTNRLDEDLRPFFSRILRIDNMKITSAQLDFSRIVPADADAENLNSKNIFRDNPDNILTYPVVENYGEGIFISLDIEALEKFENSNQGKIQIKRLKNQLSELRSDNFSFQAIEFGKFHNWQLYLIHTFSHLLMRELEFLCGYPTASLFERIFVSNNPEYKMQGLMIYTAEGAEGSMGGLIAQTNSGNLSRMIKNSLKRALICNSDPLCWESEGQGLFELNFSSCFSCSLVSETSCEHRNIYLDRQILVDSESGFFQNIIA